MNKDILTLLEENAPSFSKGQKRIARYILSDLQKAALMTAAALGKETEVSESTVVRFATELGYEGFPQMHKALQNAMMCSLPHGNDNIENGFLHLNREGVSGLAQAIFSARRIYLIAQGTEIVLAEYMGQCLEKQFPDVHILSRKSGKLNHIGDTDVAVVFGFPSYSEEVKDMADYCANAGAKVIGITNSERSPICASCAYCLFVNAEQMSYGLSMTRPMAVVEEALNALGECR